MFESSRPICPKCKVPGLVKIYSVTEVREITDIYAGPEDYLTSALDDAELEISCRDEAEGHLTQLEDVWIECHVCGCRPDERGIYIENREAIDAASRDNDVE